MIPGRFVVLMYHNLAPVSAGRYSAGIEDFKAQLSWLRAEGYTVDGFRELEDRLARRDFPERYVVLTFDDGHKSNVRAAHVVREHGAQATFFITKQLCESHPKFMDDPEIVEVSRLCSVGSHGVTHRPLPALPSEQLRAELVDSKRWLEDLVGGTVDTLSAPGGYLDPRVVRHALDAGYTLVGNSVEWWNDAPALGATRVVNRAEVGGSFSMARFRTLVRGSVTYLARRRIRSAAARTLERLPARFRGKSRDAAG